MPSRVTSLVLLLIALAAAPASSAEKLDPLARAALGALRSGASPEALHAGGMAVTPRGELDVFIRGRASRAELEAAGAKVRTALPGIATAFIPVADVDRVAALPAVEGICGSAPVELELNASVPSTGADLLRGPGPDFAGLNGSGVLIGDVDTGVDVDHGDFKDPSGHTRLIRIWDQTTGGSHPAGYSYGVEWTNDQIDAGSCNETDLVGHGTHVIGIAGGDGSQTGGSIPAFTYAGMSPKADLVMVKSDLTTTHILDGVSYIFGLATARAQNAVVNLSIGSQFGPHDGTDAFEAGLSAMTGPGRVIVKSAGNDRGTARHAKVLAAGGGSSATLSVAGSANGRNVLIDGYFEATENVSIEITTPASTVIGPITLGTSTAARPGVSTTSGNVYVENGVSTTTTGDAEVVIELTAGGGQNMNGTWTFTFIPVQLGAANGQVDLWRYSSSSGVVANFVTGNDNSDLISEPGNARDLITVGAWVSKQKWTCCNGVVATFSIQPPVGNLAIFSSPGPTRDGRRKPELTAPGTAIGSATTFDITQNCPATSGASALLDDGGNHQVMAGTSMAAPHVSGAAALIMQAHGAVTPAYVRQYLAVHAKVDAFTAAVWNRDWGNGKLYLGTSSDPLVHVQYPDSGEIIPIGTALPLQWSATSPALAATSAERAASVSTVDLAVSRDGGLTFESIAAGVPNNGVYDWTVTGPVTNDALLSVVAHDDAGAVGFDLGSQAFAIVPPTSGVDPPRGAEFALGEASPNPTSGGTEVWFAVPRTASIQLVVLDVQGRAIARLAGGVHRPGRYTAAWDGRIGGRVAPAGLYFIRYRVPGGALVKRVVVAH